jgi:transcriptional regulator with XRE-family HTH domain
MPNVDQAAKAWELELSGRVGAAVQARRKALRMTAVQLAERTKELGYHITRVAISKIEGNLRAGKIDVAELLVLAVALEIPPALLLFPTFPGGPDGTVELLPGSEVPLPKAVDWLSGMALLRAELPNDGTDLTLAVARWKTVYKAIASLRAFPSIQGGNREHLDRQIQAYEEELLTVQTKINQAKAALWGYTSTEASDG